MSVLGDFNNALIEGLPVIFVLGIVFIGGFWFFSQPLFTIEVFFLILVCVSGVYGSRVLFRIGKRAMEAKRE